MKHYITPEEHARMQRRRGRQALGLLVAILVMQIFMVIGFSHYTPWDELGVSTVPHILYGSLLYGKVGTIWMTVISLLAVISTLNTPPQSPETRYSTRNFPVPRRRSARTPK